MSPIDLFENAPLNQRHHQAISALAELVQDQLNQRNLHLFDAIDGNQQCHINSIIVASIAKNNTPHQNHQNKVHLLCAFLLNPMHTISPDLFTRRFRTQDQKLMRIFISDPEVTHAAQKILQQSITQHTLHFANASLSEEHSISPEVIRWIQQHPNIPFPKLMGINLMFDEAKRLNIPFALKCKLLCNQGMHEHTLLYDSHGLKLLKTRQLSSTDSVIVTDVIASTNKQIRSFKKYASLRKKCPHNLFTGHLNNCHNQTTACILCKKHTEECPQADLHKNFLRCIGFQIIHFACAAQFMHDCQKEPIKLLMQSDFTQMRCMTKVWQEVANEMHITNLALCAIEHMYPSTLKHALERKRQVDCTIDEMD